MPIYKVAQRKWKIARVKGYSTSYSKALNRLRAVKAEEARRKK